MAPKRPRVKPPSQWGIRHENARTGRYDPNDARFVATHEAGHAVSAIVLGLGLERVDIKRRQLPSGAISLGFTRISPVRYGDIAGKGIEAVMPHLIQALTGPLADAAVNPLVTTTGADIHDQEDSRRYAVIAVGRATGTGGGNMTISPEEIRQSEAQIAILLGIPHTAAGRLVHNHRDAITQVADLLVRHKELSCEEVAAIVKGSCPMTV